MNAGVASPVGRAVNRAWLMSHQLHDVDFATLRPTAFGEVGAEHPKCGPNALPFWHLGTNVNPAKLEFLQIHRLHARGGVSPAPLGVP